MARGIVNSYQQHRTMVLRVCELTVTARAGATCMLIHIGIRGLCQPQVCVSGRERPHRVCRLRVGVELQYFSEQLQCMASAVVLQDCLGAVYDVVAGVVVPL